MDKAESLSAMQAFIYELNRLADESSGDPEYYHSEADDTLMAVIYVLCETLGGEYPEFHKQLHFAFDRIEKWYA